MKAIITSLAVATIACLSACNNSEYKPNIETTASPIGTDIFKPDSASIAQNYRIPKWFEDAKFGIFIHWGVYSVPAYGSEWYSRWMYKEGHPINKYHVETYGPLTEFGYKDFIPMFKAENFNPQEWAELFKESGAQYVVPVAEHHDGFAMYNSTFNKWNSVDMGPKRDVIGELKKAIIAEGLHFGLSSHRCENAWFYEYGMDTPSDVQDMSISLYGERLHQPEGKGMTPYYGKYEGSNEKSRREFLLHTYELIDQYQPELIWFDWTVGKYPFQPTFYKFMAYYYNSALDWNKEVVVNTKFGYGDNIQVFDIERGKSDRIREYPWQTDTSVGKKSWSYCVGEENKSPDHIIDDFVDIVSKNGNLLLNILKKLKAGRNEEEVKKALAAITECVREFNEGKKSEHNLLDLAVKAASVRATLGEISDACEAIVGRYKAVIRTISQVYSSESKADTDFAEACELTEEFARQEGRRPRIMIAKMGQDGHDRGAKVCATGYADCGFDVDMGPLFQTPAEAARQAVENDVNIMGVSSLAAGHKTLIPQVIEELKRLGREDIMVIAGGVIPAQDYDFLYKAGVAAIFGPGTSVAKAACEMMKILLDKE